MTHVKQEKYFHHQKGHDIIRTLYYIQAALADENIFAVLYVPLL